jgi:hypothetical protein
VKKKVGVIAGVLALVLVMSGCQYYSQAVNDRDAGKPVPWWCDPVEEIPVTQGPAVGSVDYYAGTHKAPLTWDQCLALSRQIDSAKQYALQWPTAADATADGWRMATSFIPGMGTHHIRGGLTPAMLNDPSFDKDNPNLDAAGLDDQFVPSRPEVLQYDGNGPTAKLVGFDYYVRTDTGQPPAGFEGNNDWWHIHPKICFRKTDAAMVGFNTSDASCASQNGINVNMANYYMLHVWVLDDMKFIPDVYAGMIPCIAGPGAQTIHDPADSCHLSRDGSTMSAAHDMTAHSL